MNDMAIIKRAQNIIININKKYQSFSREVDETSDVIFVDSTKENLLLSSNKKVLANGNK